MIYNVAAYGLPQIEYPTGNLSLAYGNHARKEAMVDKYGSYVNKLPNTLLTNEAKLVEVETEKYGTREVYTKLIYRTALDAQRDMVFVLVPSGNAFFVKTTWINESTDNHKTLNKNKYNKPE